ncbi:hypothetical protein F2Q69_00059886 [Brassica cretica]|uniref:Uncharacterized protein n=1 Tax=Brassica cretica TaxID=69181 RepID=A0A8S9RCV3_BRACR|nr:hypothetical protein F2Q69_00059886 [Brassica cretica]
MKYGAEIKWISGDGEGADEIQTIALKKSVEKVTFSALLENICRKIKVDESKMEAKLSYFPMHRNSSTSITGLDSGTDISRPITNADLSTSGFMIPDCTALSLFSLAEHSEYRAVEAFFLALNPPVSRRFTRRGITPDLPIATLLSSTCDIRRRAQAAFTLAVGVPIFNTLTSGLMAPEEAIRSLFSSQSERFMIAVTLFVLGQEPDLHGSLILLVDGTGRIEMSNEIIGVIRGA